MKVFELKMILDSFQDDATVEILAPNRDILNIEKITLMMGCAVTVQPGGVIELTERDRAAATPICVILTRGAGDAA